MHGDAGGGVCLWRPLELVTLCVRSRAKSLPESLYLNYRNTYYYNVVFVFKYFVFHSFLSFRLIYESFFPYNKLFKMIQKVSADKKATTKQTENVAWSMSMPRSIECTCIRAQIISAKTKCSLTVALELHFY